jgi:nitroreductase
MVQEFILKRKSIVCFDQKPVPNEILNELFEAARWAPSANNQQPWRYIVGVKGTKCYNFIFESLKDGNKIWAVNAPVLIVCVAEVISEYTNKPNPYAWHDTALSFSNLVFQAISKDLYVHPMAGFFSEKIIEYFKIPAAYEPVIAAAIGYKGTCNGLPENIKERENKIRVRKVLNETVFEGKWKTPYIF